MRKLSMEELERRTVGQFREAKKMPVCAILDNVRSQQNTGSVFRTADAFMVESLFLCGITACPPHREIHRTALGATESVDWKYFPTTLEAIEQCKKMGYRIVGIEQTDKAVALQSFLPDLHVKYALVFGNEVNGISDEVLPHLDDCIEIPQLGTKHSINISVTAGIVFWDFFKTFRESLV
ncbi:MAG: RNA methyltransferase [Bacteroidota bacterium]